MATDIGTPFKFDGGQKVAANPQDKWVLAGSDHIAVITSDGRVFIHMVSGKDVTAPFQISTAAPVGASANDRFVFAVGATILVVTTDGRVFVHDLIRGPKPPQTFGLGPPIAVSVAREVSGGIKVAVIHKISTFLSRVVRFWLSPRADRSSLITSWVRRLALLSSYLRKT